MSPGHCSHDKLYCPTSVNQVFDLILERKVLIGPYPKALEELNLMDIQTFTMYIKSESHGF